MLRYMKTNKKTVLFFSFLQRSSLPYVTRCIIRTNHLWTDQNAAKGLMRINVLSGFA